MNKRNDILGYWSHVLFDGANKTRRDWSKKGAFFETSGYLFGIRNGVINKFPLHASEDSIIPFLFWEKGYRITYAEKAGIYVLSPQTWNDWVTQKKRNIKGHATLKENINQSKHHDRSKTFMNEVRKGLFFVITYPRSFKEAIWTILLLGARLYVWSLAVYEIKVKKKQYKDGWRKEENIRSTRWAD